MLTRQWQLGEFRGEDAGSPAFVEITSRTSHLNAWSAAGTESELDPSQPIEPASLGESNDRGDQLLAVELGAAFDVVLQQSSRADLTQLYRNEYPIEPLSDEARQTDPAGARTVLVLAGRRTNGLALYAAAVNAAPAFPSPNPAAADEPLVRRALDELTAMADSLGIKVGSSDAQSWRPSRLDYAFEVGGHSPDGLSLELVARSRRDGALDWHAFDVKNVASADEPIETPSRRTSVIPTNVTFRGMPNARFWSFENGTLNIAAVKPEKRELGKLLVLDFLLLHGVDWYLAPLRQPLGSLAEIQSITVQDVFGERTTVPRASSGPRQAPWTLFSLSNVTTGDPASFLFLAPVAGDIAQQSEALEQVRFARDEGANLAWAIERTVQDAMGNSRSGHERALLVSTAVDQNGATGLDGPDIAYRVQTDIPANWYPLLPVAVNPGDREVALQRGVILRDADDGVSPEPVAHILRPSALAGAPYQLDEESLPRVGILASRVVYRARWTDGSTHVWVARRLRRGSGEESSGLRFDVLKER